MDRLLDMRSVLRIVVMLLAASSIGAAPASALTEISMPMHTPPGPYASTVQWSPAGDHVVWLDYAGSRNWLRYRPLNGTGMRTYDRFTRFLDGWNPAADFTLVASRYIEGVSALQLVEDPSDMDQSVVGGSEVRAAVGAGPLASLVGSCADQATDVLAASGRRLVFWPVSCSPASGIGIAQIANGRSTLLGRVKAPDGYYFDDASGEARLRWPYLAVRYSSNTVATPPADQQSQVIVYDLRSYKPVYSVAGPLQSFDVQTDGTLAVAYGSAPSAGMSPCGLTLGWASAADPQLHALATGACDATGPFIAGDRIAYERDLGPLPSGQTGRLTDTAVTDVQGTPATRLLPPYDSPAGLGPSDVWFATPGCVQASAVDATLHELAAHGAPSAPRCTIAYAGAPVVRVATDGKFTFPVRTATGGLGVAEIYVPSRKTLLRASVDNTTDLALIPRYGSGRTQLAKGQRTTVVGRLSRQALGWLRPSLRVEVRLLVTEPDGSIATLRSRVLLRRS